MKISIFGMGYVGVVSAACLAQSGHEVVGVDPLKVKVDLINEGRTPIIEKDIVELIRSAVKERRLCATIDAEEAIKNSSISFVCVGTPSQINGNLDLKYVRRVCENIGDVLKNKEDRHIVVMRSTILPGTMAQVVIPTLEEHSTKIIGEDIGVCNNPEFMREGTAVQDFYTPPKTVIGETDQLSGDTLASLYKELNAPLIRTDIKTAEMVKYIDNVWHALKIGFANEIGNICSRVGISGQAVMEIFCQDTKLNISGAYLKPGFAFGGSCLPKDLRALTYKARKMDLDLPILNAILPSNEIQVNQGVQCIIEKGHKEVGILGFSFKAGTDDLRESPMVELVERLIGKGYDLRLYDRNVKLASLVGANRDFILNRIPHISRLMVDTIEDVTTHAKTVVIGTYDKEFITTVTGLKSGQEVVDLVQMLDDRESGEV